MTLKLKDKMLEADSYLEKGMTIFHRRDAGSVSLSCMMQRRQAEFKLLLIGFFLTKK